MADPAEADIIVVGPDGVEVAFPAGTSRDTIVSAMRRKFPAQNAQNAVGRGFSQGLSERDIRRQLDRPDPAVTGGEVSMSPQFAEWTGRPLRAAAGFALTSDPQAQADILGQVYGDVEQSTDRAGRPIVRRPGGQWTYVNRPGLSFQDVNNLGSEVVRFGAAALPAARVASLPARAVVTGGLSGATQVASDVGAVAMGSQQGVNIPNAILAGVGGAAGEVVGAAAAPLLRPRLQGSPGVVSSVLDLGSGAAARQRAEDAIRFNPELARPMGIPLTRGQLTGDATQIAFEQSAMRAGRGEAAGAIMREFARDQAQQAVEAGRGLAGPRVVQTTSPRETSAEAGERIRSALQGAEEVASDAVRQAYDVARSFDVSIDSQAFGTLRQRLQAAIPEDIRAAEQIGLRAGSDQRRPMRDVLTDVETIAQRAQQAVAEGADAVGVNFRAIEAMRSAVETQRRNLAARPGNDTAAMILTRQKAALDDWIDETVTNGLWSGDARFLEAFKTARAARREFAQRFERQPDQAAQNAVRQIIDKDMNAGAVIDVIFGAGQGISNRYAGAVTRNLVNILGKGSAEVQALRESFVDRMIAPLQDQQILSPARVAKAYKDMLDGPQRSTLKELFSDAELSEMKRFAALLDRLTPPVGTVNTSGTAYALSRMGKDLFSQMAANPIIRTALGHLDRATGNAMAQAQVEAAIRGARSVALAPRLAVGLAPVAVQAANRSGQEAQRLDDLAASLARGQAMQSMQTPPPR